jgi:uncharacterized protein (TIGR02246 family)
MTTGSPADEWALLQLAYRYAQAVDRLDSDAFTALFTEDGEIGRPGSLWQGHEQLRAIIVRLKTRYSATFHTVRNQTVTIDGNAAEGETYSIAMHILPPGDGPRRRYDMGIRYQDRFERQNGTWLFARRHLIVDWEETTDLPEA